MAGVSLRVHLDDARLIEGFDAAAHAAEDMTLLMDTIGQILVAGAMERIAVTNVGPDGVEWPKSFRVISGQGGKTLHDSGQLLNSLTQHPEPREVTVGTNRPFADVHQTGMVIRPKNGKLLVFTLADGTQVAVGKVEIPARPFLGISEGEAEDIHDAAGAYFSGALDGGH